MKLSNERGKSRRRHSEESSPSTSLSPKILPINMSPGVTPILKQNKKRGERPYNYTLLALDLVYRNYIYNNNRSINNNNKPIKNTLNLSGEIIDDGSCDETEIDSKDKHTMNINKFIQFCNKYIYSALCIDDENHKKIITKAIFENICLQNSDEIQFQQLLNAINKLKKKQFINVTAKYPNIILNQPLLVSICEHKPLTYDENANDKKQLDYSNIIIEPRDNDEKIMLFTDNNLENLLMKHVKQLFEKYDLMKCAWSIKYNLLDYSYHATR